MALKTYALKLRGPIKIAGIEFGVNDQVGAITCVDNVSPHDLLGLVQHFHATLEEVVGLDSDDDETELDLAEESTRDGATEADVTAEDEQSEESAREGTAESIEDTDAVTENEVDSLTGIAAFIADGLDEKIAKALVEANGIASPDTLRVKLNEADFDLHDLAEIGDVRAKKILAIYLK